MKLEYCRNGCDCVLEENDLERHMQEYAKLGAIPHCFFPELCEKHLVAADTDDFAAEKLVFYTSPAAFYHAHDQGIQHIHISLAQVHAAFALSSTRISFALNQGAQIDLTAEESAKLLEQAGYAASRLRPADEVIEIEAGEQLIFSTPDPMLSPEFIQFLGENFKGLAHAVYAFETTAPGQAGNLVIAAIPMPESTDLNLMSLQLAQGADLYLEDRSQIDFMILDPEETELIEIIASVSPEINLAC